MTMQNAQVNTGDADFDKFANAMEIEDTTDPNLEFTDDTQADADSPPPDESPEEVPPDGGSEPQPSDASPTPEASDGTPPPPEPEAPPAPEPTPDARLEQMQAQLNAYQQQQQLAQLDNAERQYAQMLVEQHAYEPQQAAAMARVQRQEYEQQQYAQSLNQRYQQEMQGAQGKLEYVFDLQKQYGITAPQAKELIQLRTKAEMVKEATRMKELNDLRTEVTKLKQGAVRPGQAFDNGRSGAAPSNSNEALLDRYIAGDRSPAVVAAADRLLGN